MSTNLIGTFPSIPAMSDAAIAHVRRVEEHILQTQWQVIELEMAHLIHAGLYARTCKVLAGQVITGAPIEIAVTLVIQGDCIVYLGGESRRIVGYAVIPAYAGRKQAFRALEDTTITMIFPTQARTVAEAEREFTSEWETLAPGRATTIITGDPA